MTESTEWIEISEPIDHAAQISAACLQCCGLDQVTADAMIEDAVANPTTRTVLIRGRRCESIGPS